MYGKHFEQMYTGSLFGKPALVFAVWGYAIAHQKPDRTLDGECFVELNPTFLGAMFSEPPASVAAAIELLESEDPASRTDSEGGRRLVLVSGSRHLGPMQFRVVNGRKYREIRHDEERREYNREAKRRQRERERRKALEGQETSTAVKTVNDVSAMSAQAEAEAEEEGGGDADQQPRAEEPNESPECHPPRATSEDSVTKRGYAVWRTWEEVCGGPMGAPGPRRIEELGTVVWRTCHARRKPGEGPLDAFRRAAQSFRADPEIQRKKLSRRLNLLLSQLAEWLDPDDGGGGPQSAEDFLAGRQTS